MYYPRDQKKVIQKEKYEDLIQKLLRGRNDFWMVLFGSHGGHKSGFHETTE